MNKNIQHTCYSAEDLTPLVGFRLAIVEDAIASCDSEASEVISFTFINEHHVAIDMALIDGELSIGEPYAVKDDLTRISDEEAKA